MGPLTGRRPGVTGDGEPASPWLFIPRVVLLHEGLHVECSGRTQERKKQTLPMT